MSSRSRVLVTGLLLTVLAAPVAAAEPSSGPSVGPSMAPPPVTTPSGSFDPYRQTITWTDCKDAEPGSAGCATVIVPIDHADPSLGTTTIALRRRQATGEKRGTLFINPGGPGESGVAFVGGFSTFVPAALKDAYDIIGFDPRGVGASDPLTCTDTAGIDAIQAASLDASDPAAIARLTSLFADLAKGCLTTNPDLARHMTTVETAKDLDILRAVMGEEKLDYYGGSYGTFLGATYAALYPDRVGRMVLDAAMDPSLSDKEIRLVQAGGFQLAFEDYLADCLANSCPLGSSKDEVEQKVTRLLADTATNPLPTGDPKRPLTQSYALFGITAALYAQNQWPALTEGLVAAFGGDGTILMGLADGINDRGPDGYDDNLTQANAAINCLDAPLKPAPATSPTLEDFRKASPLFGTLVAGFAEACDDWPIAPTVSAPDYTAHGAPPILVVGTTGDPATPYASAVKLAEVLESGVLLTRDGEGHGAYLSDNTCIVAAVTSYLVEGTVPADGTECAAPAASSSPVLSSPSPS